MPKELIKNGGFTKGDRLFDSDLPRIDGLPGSNHETSPAYDIERSPRHAAIAWSDWARFGDHTTGDGKMMVVTGGPGDIWRQDIHLHAGVTYTISFWARSALDGSNGVGMIPVLEVYLNGGEQVGEPFAFQGPAAVGWQQFKVDFVPFEETTTIAIRDRISDVDFNDFCLDDISVMRSVGAAAPLPAAVFTAGGSSAHERIGLHGTMPFEGAAHDLSIHAQLV